MIKISHKRTGHWRGSKWLLACLAVFAGCGSSAQPTAVGRVVLQQAGAFNFAGDTLELRSKTDPNKLAFGQIQPDGSFKIESLVDGQVTSGAPAGTYQARLVIADDDYEHKAQASKAIPKKFFSFDTSNLLVEVPNRDIQLTISK